MLFGFLLAMTAFLWYWPIHMLSFGSGFPSFSSLLSENNVQEELFDQILRGKLEFPSPDWDTISLPAKVPLAHSTRLNYNSGRTSHLAQLLHMVVWCCTSILVLEHKQSYNGNANLFKTVPEPRKYNGVGHSIIFSNFIRLSYCQ